MFAWVCMCIRPHRIVHKMLLYSVLWPKCWETNKEWRVFDLWRKKEEKVIDHGGWNYSKTAGELAFRRPCADTLPSARCQLETWGQERAGVPLEIKGKENLCSSLRAAVGKGVCLPLRKARSKGNYLCPWSIELNIRLIWKQPSSVSPHTWAPTV